MKIKYLLAASVVGLSAATMMAAPAAAQQITSGVEGTVSDADGNPLSGASITVTDTRTGQSRQSTTNANGAFRTESLVPGGPYTVTASATGFQGQTIENQFINLQGNKSFRFSLDASANESVIVVTGARVLATQLATGPGQSFGIEALEAFPSISRDIRDIIRLDPRVALERDSEVDRISCLGGNDRSNSFTVDGITQSDNFGLTDTPFAARSALPIPYDVIRETSVEFAPFDVEYGQFTGCAINVVTKSGENDFHGSAFFTFRNEDLRGDRVDGLDRSTLPFEEKRWGATLSGPIIPDRLFFFAGYEETSLPDAVDRGPSGSGLANEVNFVTQAQFDEFEQIARDIYGQDIGGYPGVTPETSVRYFGRLDAYITEGHRLELTYQHLDESNVTPDVGTNNLTGLNSFNEQGTLSDYYSARLYSNWSDNFSTEIRVSRSDISDRQGPFGFNEAQDANPTVRLAVGVVGSPGNNGLLTTGPGIFRSANALEQQVDQLKIKANLLAGDHDFTMGVEVNRLDVFNLFAINATGTLFFKDLNDFRNGLLTNGTRFPSGFTGADDVVNNQVSGGGIAATGSGDIRDTGAQFRRTIFSAYAQDKWQVTDQLNILLGGRIDWYSGDAPRHNPFFQQRYGYSNAISFGRLDPLFLPRLGFTYELFNDGLFSNTKIKGGVGIFGGGDPTVWFSNGFSNTGFTASNGSTLAAGCAGLPMVNGQIDVVVGGQFTGFPQCAIDNASSIAGAGAGEVQSTDPNLKLPSVVRANLGVETTFGTDSGFFSDWNLKVDYIYSRFRNPFDWVDLTYAVDFREGINGFGADGRPFYSAVDPLLAGCNATYVSPGVYNNLTAACYGTRRENEYMLTNAGGFESHVASFVLSKNFQSGVFTDNGSVQVNMGYAFTDSQNRRESRSSTASSNFGKSAHFDILRPDASTSNYQTAHVFTFATNFREEFFGDYGTELGLVFVARSGRPYSLTFDRSPFSELSSSRDSALLYIPTGLNDPNLAPNSDPTAVQSLIDYVNGTNCKFTPGATIGRNTCRANWFFDMDMRISQEIPGPGNLFGVNDRITLFADFDNILNLLDSDWNVFRTVPGGNFAGGDGALVDVVDGDIDGMGRYIISGFSADDRINRGTSASVWKIQLGVRYEF